MKTATQASPYALGTGMGNMGQEWGAVTGTIMQQSWETILGGLGWLAHHPALRCAYPGRTSLPTRGYLVFPKKEYRTGCGDNYPEPWYYLGSPREWLDPEL